MADLVASDVTYTLLGEEMTEGSKVRRRFKLTTAAGEYPTGGIPLDNNQLGYPNLLESLMVLEDDAGDPTLQYLWDKSANTIFVVEDDGTSGVPAEHANATFTSPDELIIEVVGW
jgi:hypothetical protein